MDIIKQILEGIRVCHNEGLVHGDIGLSNITMKSTPKLFIRITNLGTSALFAEVDGRNSKIYKSPLYVAPEVRGIPNDPKSDIWSLGILCYILLSGNFPYIITDMDSLEELHYQIANANFAERIPEDPDLQYISDECRNFLLLTLKRDPEKRPTANDLIKHPWMLMKFETDVSDDDLRTILDKLLTKKDSKKLFMSTFPITESLEIIKSNLRDDFKKIKKGDRLSFKELKDALKESEITFSSQEIRKLFNKTNKEGKDSITLKEFENAALDMCYLVNQKKLYLLFKDCSIDHNGYISKEIFKRSIIKNGLNDKEAALFLRELDNGEGVRVKYVEINRVLRKVIAKYIK